MGSKKSMRRATIFSALISLVAFLYKMGLGILSLSIILMVASLSTLLVFICKVIFIANVLESREKKRKAYFFMAVIALAFGILFLLFAVLKVGGIDTSSKNTYSGLFGLLFISFVILMFLLSIIKLSGALAKDDLMVIGLKEMTFISALTDAVIIEEFLYKVVEELRTYKYMNIINEYFPLIVAAVMLLVPLMMFLRYRRAE